MKLSDAYLTAFIAFFWVALYALNHLLFRIAEVSPWVSLIFIPSGFKAACAVIFRMRYILGIFIGSLITGFLFLNQFSMADVIVFSILSASLPYVAFKITIFYAPLKTDLTNLSFKHISVLSVIYALLNGFFHVAYHYHALFLRDPHEMKAFMSMALGDILGIGLFMVLVSQLTKLKWIKQVLKIA